MTPPQRRTTGTVPPTLSDNRCSDGIDNICKGEGEMSYGSEADRCFANWGDRGIISWSDDTSVVAESRPAVRAVGGAVRGALAVAEREPIAAVAKRRSRERSEAVAVKQAHLDRKTHPVAVHRAADTRPNSPRFGRWWLAGCVTLALAIGGGMFAPARPAKATADAARPASKRIEWVRVGQRVVTQDTFPGPLAEEERGAGATGTAVDPRTWKKLVLLAETHWDDGTRDNINVETLQPPEWIKEHDVRIGANVPLPRDLVEMGLPRDLHATVIAVEHCPQIDAGPGRVVLTTVNHLNKYVFELTIRDATGRCETVHTTGFHKFYTDSRNAWISANELRKGEQLRGVNAALTVAALASLPGVHRVYNITVEDEHVYRVSVLGALVHNNCPANEPEIIPKGKAAKGGTPKRGVPPEPEPQVKGGHHTNKRNWNKHSRGQAQCERAEPGSRVLTFGKAKGIPANL